MAAHVLPPTGELGTTLTHQVAALSTTKTHQVAVPEVGTVAGAEVGNQVEIVIKHGQLETTNQGLSSTLQIKVL